jgi:DMSO reductase family type II enzyme heme b subunit
VNPARRLGGWTVSLAAVLLSAYPATRLPAQDTTKGKVVYVKWCAECHGLQGNAEGAAQHYMLPQPRDFTGAVYKVRTTASGNLPTDADLMRAIDQGLPGSAMPEWKTRLSEGERRDVVAYIKTFSAFFSDTSQHPTVLKFISEPSGGTGAEAIQVGRQFYDSIHCRKCHGDQGRGDGPSAPTLKDDAGHPIFAADLHQGWRFRGDLTSADIYHRLLTGLDGTPMPSFSDLIQQKFLTEEQVWRLAQYVRSLSPEKAPEVRDVIHARQVTGALPGSPDDSVWSHVESYYFPLVGQVIRKPRWFTPGVVGVWVQAVHDGKSVAFRVTWDDRSQSPDTAWNLFTNRLLATVASDDSVPPALAPWPDQLAVQFPMKVPQGTERPYFLMGGTSDPVYQWRWTSMPRRAVAGLARGVERFDTLPSARAPGAQAVFDHGQWRVVFTRALATADSANELQFAVGRPIPVAFFAWDGSSAERGSRMAVSTWYFLALDQPTPPGTYISPVIAMIVTLGLGLLVVARTQRRSGASGSAARR